MANEARTVRLPGSAPVAGEGEHVLGPADPDASLSVTMVLRRSPGAPIGPSMAPATFDPAVNRPTRRDLEAATGAAEADLELVRARADSLGLRTEEVDPAGRRLVVSGTVKALEHAFGVHLVRIEAHDHQFLTYAGEVNLPVALGGVVTAVLGLDGRPSARAG
jgi:kumamolisin